VGGGGEESSPLLLLPSLDERGREGERLAETRARRKGIRSKFLSRVGGPLYPSRGKREERGVVDVRGVDGHILSVRPCPSSPLSSLSSL